MKVIDAQQAAELIQDDWTITTGGFGHCGAPEALLKAVEQRFLSSSQPNRLTLFFASGPGDRLERGINRLAHRKLLHAIVGGFWSLAPKIGEMAMRNEIQAHNWPQGVVSHMFRAIASRKSGVLTEVGLGTFIDPAIDGGCLNEATGTPFVTRVEVGGCKYLHFKALKLDCALLRGTRADEAGNISMEREANIQDVLAQAQAVRNSGGIVVVQVSEISKTETLPLASVRIPGCLVDYVVVAKSEDHWQTYGEQYNPGYCGKAATTCEVAPRYEPPVAKRIIARRAILELQSCVNKRARSTPLIVNLGIGTPETIAAEVRHNGLVDGKAFTLTVESGAVGGFPAGGLSFGATTSPDALLTQGEQFDFYDGGGIDVAFLGFGQIDGQGRINVASLGNRLNGVGGFINISQAAKRVVFCGTFTAGGLQIGVERGAVVIRTEGRLRKLVGRLERICFDPSGRARCARPLLVTERGVFVISAKGLELVEVAPGIDVEAHILQQSDIAIRVSKSLAEMPAHVFDDSRLSVAA